MLNSALFLKWWLACRQVPRQLAGEVTDCHGGGTVEPPRVFSHPAPSEILRKTVSQLLNSGYMWLPINHKISIPQFHRKYSQLCLPHNPSNSSQKKNVTPFSPDEIVSDEDQDSIFVKENLETQHFGTNLCGLFMGCCLRTKYGQIEKTTNSPTTTFFGVRHF